jgi:hypothetical protein
MDLRSAFSFSSFPNRMSFVYRNLSASSNTDELILETSYNSHPPEEYNFDWSFGQVRTLKWGDIQLRPPIVSPGSDRRIVT